MVIRTVNGKQDVAYLIAILIVIFAWLLMTYLLTHIHGRMP